MASSRGQVIERATGFTVRVFIGRDAAGKRLYRNQRVTGTKKDAQKVLTAMLQKLDTGELLFNPSTQTVRDYFEEWLETTAKGKLSRKTLVNYRGCVKRNIYPALGNLKLGRLEPRDIQKLYADMFERGLSVNETNRILSSALNHAVAQRLIPSNPCRYAEKPKRAKKEMNAMTEGEVQAFLEAARSSRMYTYFDLLLATGLRPSEGLALKWQDFDPIRKTLNIQRTLEYVKGKIYFKEPKTKRSRRKVNLHDGTVSLLLAHRHDSARPDEMIFASEVGKPLDVSNISGRYFKPCLLEAGLATLAKTAKGKETIKSKFRMYDLRHTHATMLLRANVHPKIVSERLGHTSIALTLDTYSHVLPTMQETAVAALGPALYTKERASATPVLN